MPVPHSQYIWFALKCTVRRDKTDSWKTHARVFSGASVTSWSKSSTSVLAKKCRPCASSTHTCSVVWCVSRNPECASDAAVAAIVQYAPGYTSFMRTASRFQSALSSPNCMIHSESIQRYAIPIARVTLTASWNVLGSSETWNAWRRCDMFWALVQKTCFCWSERLPQQCDTATYASLVRWAPSSRRIQPGAESLPCRPLTSRTLVGKAVSWLLRLLHV
jgi:hypothetical protein